MGLENHINFLKTQINQDKISQQKDDIIKVVNILTGML